jgi:hypothetical protein
MMQEPAQMTPEQIRNAALEEAAQVVEDCFYLLSIGTPGEGPFTRQDRVCAETREQAASAIRALKEQEPQS